VSRRDLAHNVIATLLIVVLALANMMAQAGIWRVDMEELLNNAAIRAFLDSFPVFGIPGALVVIALVAVAKLLGLPGQWAPIACIVAGVLVAVASTALQLHLPGADLTVRLIMGGIFLGLAGNGLHAGFKALVMRFQQVPPGTVIKTPKGQTTTTPTATFTEGKKGAKKEGEV
jgi:hypothetical protein